MELCWLLENDSSNDLLYNDLLKDYLDKNKLLLSELDFQYVTESQFNSVIGSYKHKIELSVFHLNIRSLNSKHRILCQFLELLHLCFDVIILSEIWSNNIDYYRNILPGYTFYYDLPPLSNVGGVGIFISNSLCHHVIDTYKLKCTSVESLWIEAVKQSKKYIIGGIYRHPNSNMNEFASELDCVMNNLNYKKTPCVIAGDLNIDLSKIDVNTDTANYVDMVLINNFTPTILMPTRITPKTSTLIDHMYYYTGSKPKEGSKILSGNFLQDISDHLANYTIICNTKSQPKNVRPLVRIFSEKNTQKFADCLKSSNFEDLFSDNDVNGAYNKFIEIVKSTYEYSFPLTRLSRARAKDKIWITAALRKSSQIKSKLYKKWLETKDPQDEIKYKEYRKIFRKVALEAEQMYYKHMFDTRTNSVKKLWRNLNTVCALQKSNCKTNHINKLNINGQTVTDSNNIANEINNYFSKIGEKLDQELRNKTNNFHSYDFKRYCQKPLKNSFFVSPTESIEVMNLITKLNNSKSPGYDNIGPRLIKEVSATIVDPLVHIFNLSLQSGCVPDKLKIGKIIPVYKKGDRCNPTNYRPISLLSIFDKLLEKLMFNRLISFIEDNAILYKYQFGFRKNYSTSLALIDVVDNIYENLDTNQTVVGIYLDLTKAFDTVNHDILLYKLQNYGIRGMAYQWFRSYLSNRQQYTVINNVSSCLSNVLCGVPQGSVLGPLLFLLYMNDISQVLPGENVKLFADDTNLFISGVDINGLNQKCNYCIDILNNWFIANRLHLNVDKTNIMTFPRTKASDICVKLNGMSIEKVECCRYLGIFIDDKLTWSHHIDIIYKKLMKYVGIFYKIRCKLPLPILKNIYFAFVHPYILYGIEIYANTHNIHLKKLITLNNKLLRILQNKPLKFPINELYLNFDTLAIPELHTQQLLLLVHKFLHHTHLLPSVCASYFTLNSSVHLHNTRMAENLHLISVAKDFGKRSVKYKASKMWNELPKALTDFCSVKQFNIRLKAFLQSADANDISW